MKQFASILTAACIVVMPMITAAQGIPATIGSLDISSSVSNPAPGQSITLIAKSYNVEIAAATVTWTSGGKVLGRGVGLDKIELVAPGAGKTMAVKVAAVAANGASSSGTITISSGTVDLIVEPGGYTHPLFRGKIPVTYQTNTRIVAIPHLADPSGKEYDPRNLVYKWRKDGSVLEDQSGYGASSIIVPGSIVPRPYDISVSVSSRDGLLSTSATVSIAATAPSVVFYRDDPLYGAMYDSEISDILYIGSERETSILAVPLGFKVGSTDSLEGLSLGWSVNGAKRPELSSRRSITLRAPSGEVGRSTVQATIQNNEDILQRSVRSITAIWSAQN